MKKIGLKIVIGALVATNAMAVTLGGKHEPVRRNQESERGAVGGGKLGAGTASPMKAMAEQANDARILRTTKLTDLETALTNFGEKVVVESKFKKADGTIVVESIKLKELVKSLTENAKSESQIKLADSILDVLTQARGKTKDAMLDKLIAESAAMLEPGSKATESELASFTSKLAEISSLARGGKATSVDEAAKTVLTLELRKKLDGCVRG